MRVSMIAVSCAVLALLAAPAELAAQTPAPGQDNRQFRKGAINEPDSSFATRPRTPTYRAFLPASVDLSPYFPPPGDQGDQSSCVGWAVGYAARAYYAITQEKRSVEPRNIPSPAYIYNSIIDPPGKCDEGSSITDALDLLKSGALSMADAPYNDNRCVRPTARDKARASDFRIDTWLAVDPRSVDQVKGELARGHPVIISLETRPHFNSVKGDAVYRAGRGEADDGAHAMAVVGYDDARQAFRLINSWGRDWGNRGYGWIAYETFVRDVSRAYAMRPARVPAPPPSPQPAPLPAPAPTPSPPPPPAPAPLAQVTFDFVTCGLVTSRNTAGGLEVDGFVGTQAELKEVTDKARALKAARVTVAVRQWPQCEALMTLERGLKAADRPRIRVVRPAAEQVLAAGSPFVIEVESPSEPSYLQVTYIQADGTAVHLLQPEPLSLASTPPRTKQVLGDGRNGGPRFTVSAPFGEEIVIVVASKAPLFTDKRPTTETERDYLTALRAAVIAQPDPASRPRVFAADYDAFKTGERKP